tara:strand:+ start:57 stop:494 length:438 start_codon:yes stop_codon:yes gene_type:complete
MAKLYVSDDIVIDVSEFDITFCKSSGPGGQSVNKNNTKARVAWNLFETNSVPSEVTQKIIWLNLGRLTKEGILIVESDKFREQKRNLRECFMHIMAICKEATKGQKKRKPTKKTAVANEKRLRDKKHRGGTKRSREKIPAPTDDV